MEGGGQGWAVKTAGRVKSLPVERETERAEDKQCKNDREVQIHERQEGHDGTL